MEYILYRTEAGNIKDFIARIQENFGAKNKIEFEKYEEILFMKIDAEKPAIIYTEFDEPLRIKPYKRALHSIVVLYSNRNEEMLFYRLKRRLTDEEKRIGLIGTKNNKEVKDKISQLLEIKPAEYNEKKYKTFIFVCPKNIEESLIKILQEIEIKNLSYIPFSTLISEQNIIENENKTFIGQIKEEDIYNFLTIIGEIGIDQEKIIFFDSSLFFYQK